MTSRSSRFSLKKKTIIVIIIMTILISLLSGLMCWKAISDISRTMYESRSRQLAKTAADLVDPVKLGRIRDQVLEIYKSTPAEERVSSDDWGSEAFETYLKKYEHITESEEFREIRKQFRVIQDANKLDAVYSLFFDTETEATVYLVDASYDDYCAPGCFDPVMYEVDREAMRHPENGIAPDITNTPEYGWVVAAGQPVFDADGGLIGFVAADISMNEVMAQQNRFLLIAGAALAVLAILFICIASLLVDRYIVRPINTLSDTSERYCGGESSAIRHEFSKLDIHTGDEIETLSNSMKQMEQNINDHITKILETTQTLISTREHAEEMNRAANIDALTKVRNKRAYDLEIERVNGEIREGNRCFGIGMIDLNGLKKVNDTYGHEKGDILIQNLCRIICRIFRHSPVFRVGGDEFVVILEGDDFENREELRKDLEQTLQQVQNDSRLDPWERVSAADGYAVFDPALDTTMESVFKRADQAMYARKKAMKAAAGESPEVR